MRPPARALLVSLVTVLLLGGAATARGERPAASKHVRARHAAPLGTFTFVGGGDIALTGAADPSVLAGIRAYLHSADLVVGNLEGTLTNGGSPKCTSGAANGCFTFRGSPSWAGTL